MSLDLFDLRDIGYEVWTHGEEAWGSYIPGAPAGIIAALAQRCPRFTSEPELEQCSWKMLRSWQIQVMLAQDDPASLKKSL
jgi:hypothetical protein